MPSDTPHEHAGHTRRLFLGQLGMWCALAATSCSEEPDPVGSAPTVPQPDVAAPVVAPVPLAPLPTGEPTVRVLIHRDRTGHPELNIGADDSILMVSAGGQTLLISGRIRLDARHATWRVLTGDTERELGDAETLDIEPMPPGGRIPVDGVAYPGILRVHRSGGGDAKAIRVDVINHVELEEYLPGVVGRELYSHWHATTFRAQAIAARSFACSEHAYFASRRHYDMTSGQSSQAYAPELAHETARQSVIDTRGQVLAHDGQLVPGYYCACCGGTAAVATDAIGPHPFNTIPPLRGRASTDHCTDAPLFRWTIERSTAATIDRLRSYGARHGIAALSAIETLRAVSACSHNAYGRPTEFALDVGADEMITLDAADTRRAFDTRTPTSPRPKTRLWSSCFDVRIDPDDDRLVVRGNGHGHGVGLCQYGAQAQAEAGRTATEILRWYYPGVTITG